MYVCIYLIYLYISELIIEWIAATADWAQQNIKLVI